MAFSYLEFYKNANSKAMEDAAFEYIIGDMLQRNLTGDAKQKELSGMDVEKIIGGNFVPSMIYVFMYLGSKEQSKNYAFIDNVPLVLCTKVAGASIAGINFNMVPNDVRAAFLDLITQPFGDYNKSVEDGNAKPVNEKLAMILSDPNNFNALMTIFKSKYNVDISSCVRNYNIGSIVKSRMIEVDMWKYIPFLSFKDAVRGVNLAELQIDLVKPPDK